LSFGILLLAGLSGLAIAAETEPSPSAVSAADRIAALAALRAGNNFLDRGQPSQALVKFQEAYRLVHSEKLNYNIAQALSAIPGREADAYQAYQAVLEMLPRQPVALLQVARVSQTALQRRVTLVTVVIDPDGAAVSMDGAPWGFSPMPQRRATLPGYHHLRIAKDGFQTFERDLTLEAGQALEEVIHLAPVENEPSRNTARPAHQPLLAGADASTKSGPLKAMGSPASPPTMAVLAQPVLGARATQDGPSSDRVRTARISPWTWATEGAALASLGVGTMFAFRAISKNSDSRRGCEEDLCNDAGWADRQAALHAGNVATVGFGVAAVLAVAGATIYWRDRSIGEGGGAKHSFWRFVPGATRTGVNGLLSF